jgi:PAS domain S-box-containing protein
MRILLNGEGSNFTSISAILTATTAFEVISPEAWQATPLDLILLDMEARDFKGIEAIDRLQRLHPHLPMVLLAGTNQEETALEAIRRGAQDYLLKAELTPTLLVRTIRLACERHRSQQHQAQSSQRYREILDTRSEMIFRYTPDFIVTYANRAYGQHHNLLPEGMIGKNILELIPEEDRARAKANVESLSASKPIGSSEHRSILPDGSVSWSLWTDQAIFDGRGKLIEFQGIGQDITPLKQLELTVRDSEELYRSLIESSGSIIALIHKSGRFHFVNEMGARQLRTTPSEIVGKFLADWFPSENANSMLAQIREVLQSGQGSVREQRISIPGAIHWYRTSIQPVRNKEGQSVFALINADDISEMKQAEEKIRNSARRLEGLNAIDKAILVANNVEELSRLAIEQLVKLVPCQRATISYVDLNDKFLFPIHSWSQLDTSVKPGIKFPIHDSYLKLIQAESYLLRTELDNSPDQLPRQLYKEGFSSMLYVGLKTGGELIGLLLLLSSDPAFFTQEYINIALEIGDILAIGISNVKMNQTIREHSAELEEKVALRTTELEYARNRAESIFHSSSDGILIIAADSTIEHANAEAHVLLEDMDKGALVFLTNETDRPMLEKAISEALLSGKIQRLEVVLRRSGAKYFEAEVGIAPLYSPAVDKPLLVCTVRDITERKLAENALRESERRYRLLADNITDMVAVHSLEGKYTYVSPSLKMLTGFEPEELVGRYGVEFVHPDDLALAIAVLGKARVIQTHYPPTITRFRHKEGHYIWLETVGQTRHSEESGTAVEFITSTRDITQRKEVEDALAEERNLLRNLIDNIPDYIYIKDKEHRYIMNNTPHARSMGTNTPAEVVGKSDFDFFPPEFAEKYYADEEEIYRSGEAIINKEEKSFGLNREPIWAATTKIPLKNLSGQLVGLVGITHDITELKRTQEIIQNALENEQELSELKSRFISMASHEFRTPLAIILVIAENLGLYRDRMDEHQIEQRIVGIKKQVKRLTDIIEDMLDLSRIQANRIEFKPILTDLDAFCKEIIEEFENRLDVLHPFSYSCIAAPLLLKLDKTLFHRIMNNLLSNAVKYSNPGSTIFINVEKQAGFIQLQIRDEGIGIPEADIKHIFEPFHRAANVEAISGTGLGLVIAKHSVELHGGSISLDSTPDIGTTVTVSLPDLK